MSKEFTVAVKRWLAWSHTIGRVAEQAESMLRELSVQKYNRHVATIAGSSTQILWLKESKRFRLQLSQRGSPIRDTSPSQSQQFYRRAEVTARTPYHRHSQSLNSPSSHPRPSKQPRAKPPSPKHVYYSVNAILSKCQDINHPGESRVPINLKILGVGPKMVVLRIAIWQPRTTSMIPHSYLLIHHRLPILDHGSKS